MAKETQDQEEPDCWGENTAQQTATQENMTRIIGTVASAVIGLCLLLLVSGYRVLVGEEKPATFEPDMSGEPQWIGGAEFAIDARLLPPFHFRFITCRYFTGRAVTTVTFDRSEIDSCPFVYRPKEYDSL